MVRVNPKQLWLALCMHPIAPLDFVASPELFALSKVFGLCLEMFSDMPKGLTAVEIGGDLWKPLKTVDPLSPKLLETHIVAKGPPKGPSGERPQRNSPYTPI